MKSFELGPLVPSLCARHPLIALALRLKAWRYGLKSDDNRHLVEGVDRDMADSRRFFACRRSDVSPREVAQKFGEAIA